MELRRREVIALLLGVPAWLEGCGQSRPPLPPGELLGQSFSVGHRLRDGEPPVATTSEWHDVDVAIVGGGVAGLAAARRLDRAGIRNFVVLELEPVAGGTARSGDCPTSRFPWGAHYVPVPLPGNAPLIELLREVGAVVSVADDGSPVIAEEVLCREPEERLFLGGEWLEGLYPAVGATERDLAELAAFRAEIDRWTQWRDQAGRRAFSIPTRLATDAPEVRQLDRLSMRDWLRERGWDSRRLHWLVDYSCRDDYGLSAEETSAWAGLLYFVARQAAPGAEHQPLMTWPEGNGRLVAHLAAIAGDRLRTGFAVAKVTPSGETRDIAGSRAGGWVQVTGFDAVTNEVAGYRARRVVFAAPQYLAGRLIDGFGVRRREESRAFQYGSWLVANLQLRERPEERGFAPSWDNVLHDSRSLGYVVATHQTGSDLGPTVWTWYHPYSSAGAAAREALFRATRDELAEVVLTDLEAAHPDIRRLVTRLDLFRWGHAMVAPRVGFLFSPARLAAARPEGLIHFAHTDLSGLALFEEAFDHGNRAADEIVEALS